MAAKGVFGAGDEIGDAGFVAETYKSAVTRICRVGTGAGETLARDLRIDEAAFKGA